MLANRNTCALRVPAGKLQDAIAEMRQDTKLGIERSIEARWFSERAEAAIHATDEIPVYVGSSADPNLRDGKTAGYYDPELRHIVVAPYDWHGIPPSQRKLIRETKDVMPHEIAHGTLSQFVHAKTYTIPGMWMLEEFNATLCEKLLSGNSKIPQPGIRPSKLKDERYRSIIAAYLSFANAPGGMVPLQDFTQAYTGGTREFGQLTSNADDAWRKKDSLASLHVQAQNFHDSLSHKRIDRFKKADRTGKFMLRIIAGWRKAATPSGQIGSNA